MYVADHDENQERPEKDGSRRQQGQTTAGPGEHLLYYDVHLPIVWFWLRWPAIVARQ
jgi:hypothetical protein